MMQFVTRVNAGLIVDASDEAAEHARRVHDAAGHVPETGRCTQWPTRATATGLTVYCVSGGVPEGTRRAG